MPAYSHMLNTQSLIKLISMALFEGNNILSIMDMITTALQQNKINVNVTYRLKHPESVLEKIKELPDIYKDILYDREVLKMKYEEIAQKHKMKKRAVATRIRRGRLKIRKMFPNVKIIYND